MALDDWVIELPTISKRELKEASERYQRVKAQLKPIKVYSEQEKAEILRERAENVEALRILRGIDGSSSLIQHGSIKYNSRYESQYSYNF